MEVVGPPPSVEGVGSAKVPALGDVSRQGVLHLIEEGGLVGGQGLKIAKASDTGPAQLDRKGKEGEAAGHLLTVLSLDRYRNIIYGF